MSNLTFFIQIFVIIYKFNFSRGNHIASAYAERKVDELVVDLMQASLMRLLGIMR